MGSDQDTVTDKDRQDALVEEAKRKHGVRQVVERKSEKKMSDTEWKLYNKTIKEFIENYEF